jgi:hypothetical protein
MLMAATVLGALHERNRTGVGRRLEIAMQDAMIHYMRTCFATMARTGKPAQRRGSKPSAGNNAPAGLYPAKGGGPNDYLYITTSRANPEHWTRLMKLIGREDLIEDPRFATGEERVKHSEELDRIIGEWTSKHDKRDAMEKLIAISVPAGAVFDTLELQNEPDFEERGFMQQVQHHNGDDKMATWPVRIDGKTIRLKGAPALGGNTAEVLQNWLGLGSGDSRRIEIRLGNQIARAKRLRAGQLRLRVHDGGPISGDHGARLRRGRFSLAKRRLRRFVLCVVERRVETSDDVAGMYKGVVVDQQRLDDSGFLRPHLDRRHGLQRAGRDDASSHGAVGDFSRRYPYLGGPPQEADSDRADGDGQDCERQREPMRASHDRYYDPHA